MYNSIQKDNFNEFKGIIHDIMKKIGHPFNSTSPLLAITIAALINTETREGLINNHFCLRQGARLTDILNKYAHDTLEITFAENSRETLRKNYIKKLVNIGAVHVNVDNPDRATNSGKTNYTIDKEFEDLIYSYDTPEFDEKATKFTDNEILRKEQRYNTLSRMAIKIKFPDGSKKSFSPGKHNYIQKEIIEKIIPKLYDDTFSVVYIGDTSYKNKILNLSSIEDYNINLNMNDKIPDVIVYHDDKLLIFEAVSSVGPIDEDRRVEIEYLLTSNEYIEKVYYTVFDTTKTFRKFANNIAAGTKAIILENDYIVSYNKM